MLGVDNANSYERAPRAWKNLLIGQLQSTLVHSELSNYFTLNEKELAAPAIGGIAIFGGSWLSAKISIGRDGLSSLDHRTTRNIKDMSFRFVAGKPVSTLAF